MKRNANLLLQEESTHPYHVEYITSALQWCMQHKQIPSTNTTVAEVKAEPPQASTPTSQTSTSDASQQKTVPPLKTESHSLHQAPQPGSTPALSPAHRASNTTLISDASPPAKSDTKLVAGLSKLSLSEPPKKGKAN